ncbi:LLM class flavin-dependent oxidoreductase [Nocardiopsis sp. MG754419]|uniref:LLM class flavin-dependent oxidoreductase n=1 Tax=Nocardiopsis sp. MG754419 TaxID=2259865 RepID=UPI001BADE78D|nr:LLM class flavin-dependent oxidoreductase [Nocardiopsis sp. MG754419]MBR8740672.1 hypothetical protein [Nocardiopsis sp. MG754419]
MAGSTDAGHREASGVGGRGKRPLRFGVHPPQTGVDPWASAAEAQGYGLLTAPDHTGAAAPFSLITVAVAVTTRLRLGASTLHDEFENPAWVSADFAGRMGAERLPRDDSRAECPSALVATSEPTADTLMARPEPYGFGDVLTPGPCTEARARVISWCAPPRSGRPITVPVRR